MEPCDRAPGVEEDDSRGQGVLVAQEPGDHVRVELSEGTGHGARIVLTVTGTDPAERDAAVEQWGTGAVGHLAAAAAAWATSPAGLASATAADRSASTPSQV